MVKQDDGIKFVLVKTAKNNVENTMDIWHYLINITQLMFWSAAIFRLIRECSSHVLHVQLHLNLGHLADAFVQSDLQHVHYYAFVHASLFPLHCCFIASITTLYNFLCFNVGCFVHKIENAQNALGIRTKT